MAENVTITGLTEIISKLSLLKDRMKSLRPVLGEVANMIENTADEAFENQKTPWGTPWKPNTVRTVHTSYGGKTHTKKGVQTKSFQRFAAGKQILILSGQLRNSIHHTITGASVTVGTNKIYAAIHQFGGDAGRNKSVKLPARPYMPIKDNRLWEGQEQAILRYLERRLVDDVLGNR